jgi:hypothetical protein
LANNDDVEERQGITLHPVKKISEILKSVDGLTVVAQRNSRRTEVEERRTCLTVKCMIDEIYLRDANRASIDYKMKEIVLVKWVVERYFHDDDDEI